MVRVRNAIFNCINVIPLVLGLSAIAVSIYFSHSGGTACQSSVRNPLLIIGLIFIIVSVFAFLSSCFENTSIFLTIYSILLIFIILALFCVTFFALIISNKALSKKVIGIGVGSLRVKDYSNWLKNNFVDNGHWEEARSCLSDSHICKTLHSDKHLLGFVKHKFSMIQSGPDVPDSDCLTWSNDKNKLCFDCKSCKGGFLDDLRKQWRFLAFVNLGILVIIFIVFNFSCCVRRRKNPAPDGVA
ncbi:hypothetical protein F3Y22_tig00111073pilonHSYRG00005 [Hibiscus syriacus]|uniref:Tetraspanin-8-like n=1 Tax=Hibiscus syriacus TaxID=106335 RepID=A0A6A2Z3R0_HIBSY|nr:hypothetical protein F3Y22_tig00111073pilonHSYRG00005 [Hibiscus syriacus]